MPESSGPWCLFKCAYTESTNIAKREHVLYVPNGLGRGLQEGQTVLGQQQQLMVVEEDGGMGTSLHNAGACAGAGAYADVGASPSVSRAGDQWLLQHYGLTMPGTESLTLGVASPDLEKQKKSRSLGFG